jgi:hypothetical protein
MRQGTILATVLLLLSACAGVPKESFDSYRNSFHQARTASEDVILRGKIAAKALADDPGNTASPAKRLAKLKEREQLADDRLLALDTIERYNTVLVKLAEGKKPEEVSSDLKKFGNCLSQIGSSRLTAVVGTAVPYVGIAGEIIALVDDSMNRKKFLELVRKGGVPVRQILDILVADAGNIETIISQQIVMPIDNCDNRLSDLRFRFQKSADKLQATQQVSDLVKEINISRAKAIHRVEKPLPMVVHTVGAGAAPPGQAELAILRLLVDATEAEVATANSTMAKEKAYDALMDEYRKLLVQTKTSLIQLEQAVEQSRPAATVDFINRAFTLREAAIKLKEVN